MDRIATLFGYIKSQSRTQVLIIAYLHLNLVINTIHEIMGLSITTMPTMLLEQAKKCTTTLAPKEEISDDMEACQALCRLLADG